MLAGCATLSEERRIPKHMVGEHEMRDLGALGESTLTTWAAARGIAAQKVTHDRTGWDYLLEFPSTRSTKLPTLPRDKEPASVSCLVQVKATGTGKLNPSVTLANWQRLITSPLPAFFLIVDFGLDEIAKTAYLVPVDASCIGRVLKRVRRHDSRSEEIAKRRLNVKCREEHRLETPNGESLERAIRDHIGSSLEEYIQKKMDWVRTAGYESTRGSFTFEFSAESLQGVSFPEYLVDLSLGLRESLAVGHTEFRDVRFDIPAREPYLEFPSGEFVIIRKPVDQVEVTLRLGTTVVRTKMDMFLPCGLGKSWSLAI